MMDLPKIKLVSFHVAELSWVVRSVASSHPPRQLPGRKAEALNSPIFC
jgi:hypothetical protein